jgi:predicted dehydrogenase
MKNKSPLSIAFIGGSLESAVGTAHKIASQMDSRFELVAGCFSRNSERNLKTANSWGVESQRVYANFEELLQNEKGKVDAVAILTPISTHYEIIKKSLQSGYAVICEKTLTDSSLTADDILKITQQENKFLTVTYNYSGYPMLRELKNMIAENILGEILHVHAEMPQESFICLDENNNAMKPQEWRLQDQNNVSTMSLDLGSHLHHLIYFLTDAKPLEVFATANSFGHFAVNDYISSISKWEKDIECNIWYSKAALGCSNGLRIRIFGTKGSAQWYQMEPETLHYSDQYGSSKILNRKNNLTGLAKQSRYNRFKAGHFQGFIEAFANYYNDVADCLEEYQEKGSYKSPFVFDANMAKQGLEFLEAINQSIKTKSMVKVG